MRTGSRGTVRVELPLTASQRWRLLSDVTLNCVNGVRSPARRLPLTPHPKSQFHIFHLLSLTFPFCFSSSTHPNNHKKHYQDVFRAVCPLPCLPSFWILFLSILLNAVSLGRLLRQLVSSLCDLDRTLLTRKCFLQCRRWSYWFGRHGTFFQLALRRGSHSGNYQDTLLIMMPGPFFIFLLYPYHLALYVYRVRT